MIERDAARTMRHELGNLSNVLAGRLELHYDTPRSEIDDVPEKWQAIMESDRGSQTRDFVNAIGDYIEFLETGDAPEYDAVETILNKGQWIDDAFSDVMNQNIKDAMTLVPATDDYLKHVSGGRIDGIPVGKLFEPFEIFEDNYDVNYTEPASPLTTVNGNRGLLLPFHTMALNEEAYWENPTEFDWEDVSQDPRLEFDVSRTDQEVNIKMGDNGPGLPDDLEDYDRIFDEEFSSSGGGYGLPMARRVLADYGGTIEYSEDAALESAFKEGKGFGLEISLPAQYSTSEFL